jgi:hypothetical protein
MIITILFNLRLLRFRTEFTKIPRQSQDIPALQSAVTLSVENDSVENSDVAWESKGFWHREWNEVVGGIGSLWVPARNILVTSFLMEKFSRLILFCQIYFTSAAM